MKMANRLEGIFPDHSNKPKLVIALDEAHPLTPMHQVQGVYRPADIFCRVVNEYSHHREHAVWVVFASMTSKVADFSPPNHKRVSSFSIALISPLSCLSDNSDRVAIRGEKLFPPYTQLGWDQSAVKLGGIDIEDVSQLHHIAGYGRPLYVLLPRSQPLID
jgi:hypothetical protein